jgi:ABC-type multidrug transport system ATPase subunit
MAVLGPSGAGKTTLVEILAGKFKAGVCTGEVSFPAVSGESAAPRVGFVSQQDMLPPMLTVREALLFAARLKLPEAVPFNEKALVVDETIDLLGLREVANKRIGWNDGGRTRGLSGGEMRRVSIGLELVAKPDVLILDEPTSGLDSVSASRVAAVLHALAHDPERPTAVIASIHQPSSQLYHSFDQVMLLSHGRSLYVGPGGFAPQQHLAGPVGDRIPFKEGYNVADWLLEVASDPPLEMFGNSARPGNGQSHSGSNSLRDKEESEVAVESSPSTARRSTPIARRQRSPYSATFLTQLQVLSGREWKTLRRDKTLFLTHTVAASILGVFCGGLYFKTGDSIAGFQSRIGCLFFLGALIAFSSLSSLYQLVEIRPLFVRERSNSYYSPTAWLLSRVVFDIIPLRIIPTILVSTMYADLSVTVSPICSKSRNRTYWMAGLAQHPANFFKFLFILVLFTIAMTLWVSQLPSFGDMPLTKS